MRRILNLAPGLTLLLACAPATGGIGDGDSTATATETGTGDGNTGDGDGESGDGDGDSGDGDGDTGDGDGDTGDGDGDTGDGDGDMPCTELGCACDGSPGSCDQGLLCEGDMCVPELCGNMMVDDVGEECDDGNDVDGDGCDNDCSYTTLELSGGGLHTCATIETGRIRCWGAAATGGLGYGNTDAIGDDETPASAGDVSLPGGVLHLDLGGLFSCGLFEDDQMRCWGAANVGQTGYSATTVLGDDELLDNLPSIMLGGTSMQFESAGTHTCVLLDIGEVRCWGGNSKGQLGIGATTVIGDNEHPAMGATVDLGPNDVAFVSTGGNHSCAVTVGNDLYCWGENNRGQLGYGSNADIGNDEDPVMVGPVDMALPDLDMNATITALALGKEHACSLFSTGDVVCWGHNNSGQLGQANNTDWGDSNNEFPSGLSLIDLGGAATAITAGDDFTCALLDTGNVLCWGANGVGQLGQGHNDNIGDDEAPSAGMKVGLGANAIQVAAGSMHACAVLDNYKVMCWGEGGSGQLGYGNTNDIGDDEVPSMAGTVSVL